MSGRKRARAPQLLPSPAITGFLRGYLHQDAGLDHVSPETAFDQFWGEVSTEERARFAQEWRVFNGRISGRVWRRVRPLLDTLGASWIPEDGKAFARLRQHISRSIAAVSRKP